MLATSEIQIWHMYMCHAMKEVNVLFAHVYVAYKFIGAVILKKRCQRQQRTLHTHGQNENYNSSNWTIHQLITVTL